MSPPDHSNAPDHIKERDDGTLEVGKRSDEKKREKAQSESQQDRIEAKLDLLLDELGVDY